MNDFKTFSMLDAIGIALILVAIVVNFGFWLTVIFS